MLLPTSVLPTEGPFPSVALFHGTSADILEDVLQNGLQCRSKTGRNNYADIAGGSLSSHPDYVYLTTQNYLSHALNVTLSEAERQNSYITAMIVKLDLARLDVVNLYPDEDYLRYEGERLMLPEARLPKEDFRTNARNSIEANKNHWTASLFEYPFHVVAYKYTLPLHLISAISIVHPDGILADCFCAKNKPAQSGGLRFRRFDNVSEEVLVRTENAFLDYVWGAPICVESVAAIREYRDANYDKFPNADHWDENLKDMENSAAYVFNPNAQESTWRSGLEAYLSV